MVTDVRASDRGRVFASARSGADGSYRLELPEGTYTLDAVSRDALIRCAARTVTVTAARTTAGDITCDTGLR